MIENVRKSFLTIAEQNSERFHSSDVEKVRKDDWSVQRFILANKSEEAALKALVKAMEWRKSFGVNELNDEYFSKEFYKIGYITTYCKDKEDRPIVWMRFNRYYKCKDFDKLIRQFTVYHMERADKNSKNEGWAIVADSNGAGLSNVDMDYDKFFIELMQDYYPRGVKYIAVVDLPWILNATAKVLMAFMNPELKNCVKFINKHQLSQYMDPTFIPINLKGYYDKELVVIPTDAKPIEELTHTKFMSQQIKKFRSTFKEWLQ